MAEVALPPLSDAQIRLLFSICEAGSTSSRPPFAALSMAYDAEFERNGLNTAKDNAVFRWIMRIGDLARIGDFLDGSTDYVRILSELLFEVHGVTIIDGGDSRGSSDDSFADALEYRPDPDPLMLEAMEASAASYDRRALLRQSLNALRSVWEERVQERNRDRVLYSNLHEHNVNRRCILLSRTISCLRNDLHRRIDNERHAISRDRSRLLKNALDKLSHETSTRRLDRSRNTKLIRRVLRQWIIRTRAQRSQYQYDQRMKLGALIALQNRATEIQDHKRVLESLQASFHAKRQLKTLSRCFTSLRAESARIQDAKQASSQFYASRTAPRVVSTLTDRLNRSKQLDKMAKDFRFYHLTMRTMHLWHSAVKKRRRERLADGYSQIRAKVKLRLARECMNSLRTRHNRVQMMNEEAVQREQARVFKVGTEAFDIWHAKTIQLETMRHQAEATCDARLQAIALTKLCESHSRLISNEQQALHFRQESNLMCAATAMKKLQWTAFTTKRREESADALRERNQKQRLRQMLKFLATQTAVRRTGREQPVHIPGSRPTFNPDLLDPDSPSLRPASRLAARSILESSIASSSRLSVPVQSASRTTPAYQQTPARSRKIVRFRPLPTPAPITPFRLSGSKGRWTSHGETT